MKRGDVILVHYPFSSGSGTKLRPALVVQSDLNNQRLSNVIVAAITSTTHRSGQSTQLLVEVITPAGQQAGLIKDSVVTCENLATIARARVTRRIGSLPDAEMKQIDDCLKASLGIS